MGSMPIYGHRWGCRKLQALAEYRDVAHNKILGIGGFQISSFDYFPVPRGLL